MRKLTLTLTAAALALGTMALTANAQTQQPGAASLHAQSQNFTPIIKQAACNGYNRSLWLRPGMDLGAAGGRCRCVRCY